MRIGVRHKDKRFFPFDSKGEALVGSEAHCDVFLDDQGVASQHARIKITSLGIELDALSGANGLAVNGYPTSRHFLARGDEVRIGNAVLRLEFEDVSYKPGARCQRCHCELESPGETKCAHCSTITPAPPRVAQGSSRFNVRLALPSPVPKGAPGGSASDGDAFDPIASIKPASVTKRIARSTLIATEIEQDYDVLGILGEGSQGRVYKLQHRETGRIVAAKDIHAGSGPRSHARFERETEALRRLQHPAIVALLDVVPTSFGTYLLMEYVDGPSLAAMIKSGTPLNPQRALAIAARIADGLAFAAGLSIVHRDVKPSNILVGAGDAPKLVDFGLVTFSDHGTKLTAEGQWIGTPHYMAPEQMKGVAVEARTDVWGLGATFYHAIAGKLPFQEKDATDLFKKLTSQDVDVAPIAARAGPEVARLFARMLSRNVGDRPSAAEAAAQLASLARGPSGA